MMEAIYNTVWLDKNSTQELLETRFYLEAVIARLAARRNGPKDIDRLNKIVDLMEVSSIQKNNKESIRYDIEFHQTLADISQNMVLKHLLLAISTMIKRFLEDYTKIPGTSKSAINYHKRIIKAIVEKDSDLAEAEMIAHPMDVIKTLREELNLNVRLSD